jgi:hypothetical protein
MPNMDESHNGPAIKHSIRVLDTVAKKLTVIVTVISPFRDFSDPIHDQFSVSCLNSLSLYLFYKKRAERSLKRDGKIRVKFSNGRNLDAKLRFTVLA